REAKRAGESCAHGAMFGRGSWSERIGVFRSDRRQRQGVVRATLAILYAPNRWPGFRLEPRFWALHLFDSAKRGTKRACHPFGRLPTKRSRRPTREEEAHATL